MRNRSNVVTKMRLTAAIAEKRIRAMAADTANVILGIHAMRRMEERGFIDIEVFRILRTGNVEEAPRMTDRQEWKCKVTRKLKGGRTAGVVVVILHQGKLFVKTVEWEDL